MNELNAETIQEYERLSFDVWFQVENYAKEILETIKVVKDQKGFLGSEEQQKSILSNLNELEELVNNLRTNRLKAVIPYDYEGLEILKEFFTTANEIFKRYDKFKNDKLGIWNTLLTLVQKIQTYLQEIKDDDYYRKQKGTDWLPSKITFDPSSKPQELSKVEKESSILFDAIDEMKKDKTTTHTLSREDLDETAQKLIETHHDKKKRIELFWKLLKGGE